LVNASKQARRGWHGFSDSSLRALACEVCSCTHKTTSNVEVQNVPCMLLILFPIISFPSSTSRLVYRHTSQVAFQQPQDSWHATQVAQCSSHTPSSQHSWCGPQSTGRGHQQNEREHAHTHNSERNAAAISGTSQLELVGLPRLLPGAQAPLERHIVLRLRVLHRQSTRR